LKKLELTSPAGNIEKGILALHYGADSVYIGFPGFSLRSGAETFPMEELQKLTDEAHRMNKKIYYAFNIFAHNQHIPLFREALEKTKDLKPDGLILSDPGLLSLARKTLPDIHLSVSTQANITNYETVNVWKSIGADRIILARELSIDEIKQVRDHTELELEVFVHGAICMSYSGRCLLSSFMTAPELGMTHHKFGSPKIRQANLGDCVQPCRFKYALVEENRRDLAFPIEEDQWGTYVLSAKDLCLLEHLNELIQAGVEVFKIEGRMKSLYYVADMTRVYRAGLDLAEKGEKISQEVLDEVYKVSHRGYSTGFTVPEPGSKGASYTGYIKTYQFLAMVEGETEPGLYKLKVFNAFSDNMEIEAIGPGMKNKKIEAGRFSLYDKEKKKIETIRHQFDGFMKTDEKLSKYDILRVKIE